MSSRKPPVAGNPSLTVIRIMLGACVAGALSVATGLVPMSGYVNEAEMLHSTKDERAKLKPHRCNDRVEDLIMVVTSEDGSMWRDFRPALGLWLKCMRSQPGHEPADPYRMLMPGDLKYMDAATRARLQAEVRAQAGGGAAAAK